MEKLTSNKSDRRILKTKKAIYDALFELMRKKKLNSITVTELSSTANINRKTFYTYYATVNDVLDECMDEIVLSMKNLIYDMSEDYNMLSPQALFAFLNTIVADSEFSQGIIESSNSMLLLNKFQLAIQETILNVLNDNDIKINIPPEYFPFIASYIAGGMVSVYHQWICEPNGVNLEDMTQTLTSLITSGVQVFS